MTVTKKDSIYIQMKLQVDDAVVLATNLSNVVDYLMDAYNKGYRKVRLPLCSSTADQLEMIFTLEKD